MDPFGHPDLQRLGRTLRHRLDETLDAEQDAARSVAIRRRTLRDRFIEIEDRTATAVVATSDGQVHRGRVNGVGVDHVSLVDHRGEIVVTLEHVVSVSSR